MFLVMPVSQSVSEIILTPSSSNFDDATWDGDVTLGAFNIGTAVADRMVVACVTIAHGGGSENTAPSFDTVQIDGVNATILMDRVVSDNGDEYHVANAIAARIVSSGTSVNVRVQGDQLDSDADAPRVWVTVYHLTGAGTGTPTAADTAFEDEDNPGNNQYDVNADVKKGGCAIACMGLTREESSFHNPNGLTEETDDRTAPGQGRHGSSFAGGPFLADETPRTMNIDGDTQPGAGVGGAVLVVFDPA